MQLACQAARRRGEAGRRAASSAGPQLPRPRGRRPASPACPTRPTVWMSHGDQVQTRRRRLRAAGRDRHLPASPRCGTRTRPVYGLQFHPEVSHTPHGGADPAQLPPRRLRLPRACGRWQSFIDQTVAELRERVGKHRVICGLSGGVDSSVTAALLRQGDRPAGGVHLRRQRPAARRARPRRSGTRSATTSRPTCTSSTPGERFLDGAGRRHRPAGEAARSSATCSSTCSRTRRSASRTPSSWPRARSTPT